MSSSQRKDNSSILDCARISRHRSSIQKGVPLDVSCLSVSKSLQIVCSGTIDGLDIGLSYVIAFLSMQDSV